MSQHGNYATAALATAGVLGAGYFAFRFYQESRKTKLPERWTRVGTLTRLDIYPIKSCRAIPIEKVECTFLGLKDGWLRDRILMVVDEANNFITARVYQELYSIQPSIENSVLSLSAPGFGSVKVDLAEIIASKSPKESVVWEIEVPTYDCGDEISEWITKVINHPPKKFRLAYYATESSRKRASTGLAKAYNVTETETGAFTDDTSYNIINEASVADLNTRLRDGQVTVGHFRPNFVVSGAKAYDEDNWKFVKIGENIFEVVMPCVRCAMTTIDPETGVRNQESEPLKTLRSYRLVESEKHRKATGIAPRMGLQMALRSGPGGVITLNDDIYVA